MFWLGVRVLFWRQIFGFKHRWVMSALSIAIPIFFISLFHMGELPDISEIPAQNNTVLGHLYSRRFLENPIFSRFPHPLTVIVVPKNSNTSALMTEVQSVLQSQYSNSSSLALNLRFAESPKDLNRSLADSDWPSIGVVFHSVTNHQLKYTLRPVISSNTPQNVTENFDDDISPYSLLLQAAIDTSYAKTSFPGSSTFPKFPELLNLDEQTRGNVLVSFELHVILTIIYHTFVSTGIVTLMIFLATYIVRDKSSGVRELLCVNGLPRWMVNTSWLFTFSLVAAVIAVVETFLFKIPPSNPVLPGISGPALLVYLIVYHWTVTFSVYLVANIFTSQIWSVFVLLVYYKILAPAGWSVVLQLEENLVAQAFISLLPEVGSSMFCVAAVNSVLEFEKDISLKNMFSITENFISPGLVILMMLISLVLLLGLGMYFDAVKPGPYGRASPWYLFTMKEKPTTDQWFEAETPSEALIYEPLKDGVPVGLECVNIVKKFGTHKALNNVNLRIIKNNITVLLGHNGAGKTTLFSILCGMFSPTSGDVFTDQYKVFEGNNINKFRSVLGYCPQENLLMQELTVQEHLIVFGVLKGLAMSEATDYGDKWTKMFDLYSMGRTQAKNLSGGSKRKLSLAIAMTGNPQYLLLDEPSAGLDVESVKKFCDILLQEKGNCTVVMTTHNMDEAEMLGERIAILAHGELKCFGSPSFLKTMLDTGYHLNCSIISSMSTQDAIKGVTELIPGANILYKTNHSVSFSLPVNRTKDIPDLLHKLESEFGEKMSSSLSASTLDDVFLKVQKDMGVKIAVEEMPTISEDTFRRSSWNFTELFKKRAKWMLTPRMVPMILLVILLPNIFMIITMDEISIFKDGSSERVFLIDSFSRGGIGGIGRLSLILDYEILRFRQSAPMWESIASREMSKNMNGNMTKKRLFKYRSKTLFAIETRPSDESTTLTPHNSGHGVPKTRAARTNDFIQLSTSIITHNSPFMKHQVFKEVSYRCPTNELVVVFIGLIFSLFAFSLLLASSYFIVFPHIERTTVFKHLQLMTGQLPAAYWLTSLAFDMLIYIVSCALTIIIIASMDRTAIFLKPAVMSTFTLILLLYGLSSITYSYLWSFFCDSLAWTILAVILFSDVFPGVLEIAFTLFWPRMIEYVKIINIIMPYRILLESMKKLIEWAIRKRDCTNCSLSNQGQCFYLKNNPLEELKSELITLAAQATAWFVLLLLSDHGLLRKCKGSIARICCKDIRSLNRDVNPEVALERKRVKDMVINENKDNQPELIVNDLGKNFCCGKTAVYEVTFAAERGECFGLVGVNGSGKTTTFGMLAAVLSPTKGTAIIEGTWKLTGCEYNYIKRVGYCPQYNGLLKELSGRTTLELFGRLRGVPRSQIAELVDKWINALDMDEIAERPCGQYSGGNKRKLSMAIALIGNAPVALLDEPTAGVDPVVRRRIWEILSNRLEQNQTIVLTSHTMSECEAVCDRLTIMVKGVMKCLGPIPALKKTFGKRSILEVKFTSNSTIQEQNGVKSRIESEFSGYISLEDRLLTRLKFNLNTENAKMYDLFATMLRIQSDYKVMEDFSLTEAPLEQVFMMFAKKKDH